MLTLSQKCFIPKYFKMPKFLCGESQAKGKQQSRRLTSIVWVYMCVYIRTQYTPDLYFDMHISSIDPAYRTPLLLD